LSFLPEETAFNTKKVFSKLPAVHEMCRLLLDAESSNMDLTGCHDNAGLETLSSVCICLINLAHSGMLGKMNMNEYLFIKNPISSSMIFFTTKKIKRN
jgi:hypothetical protein